MRLLSVFALAALMLLPLAFADVGPSPLAPTVVVHLVKNGQPDTSVSEITYVCSAITEPTDSPVGQNTAVIPCVAGTCTNDGEWFYKLNPCYDFPGGFFTIDGAQGVVDSGVVSFDKEYSKYEMTIDSATGLVKSSGGSDAVPCLPAVLLPAILGVLMLRKE